MARAFEMERDRLAKNDLTVSEAVQRYIKLKEPVLSPATIRSYSIYADAYFGGIGNTRINALKDFDVQLWVNSLAADYSPKTIRNVYGLFFSAVKAQRPGILLNVTLPERRKPELYTPTSADIATLLSLTEGTELYYAIALAAFATLRRGEIVALMRSDLDGDKLTVRSAIVYDRAGGSVRKAPKTYSSYRTIVIPGFLAEALAKKEDRLVELSLGQITDQFRRLVKREGLPHIRFHDLRHYSASMMHAAGIPDQYIMARGGWQSDFVMKRVYIDTMDDQQRRMNEKINDLFSQVASGG